MNDVAAKISVVIPAHNAQLTIERTLRSVVAQQYDNLEVIVVNDASVDRTAELVNGFVGLDICLLDTPGHVGVSAARNQAIEAATGDYVAFLDADDEWLPGKLTKQMAVIAANPAISFVSCEADFRLVGNRPGGVINPNRGRPEGPDGWKLLLAYCCVSTPCVLVRRSALLECGGFDTSLPLGEDQDLWIRLALVGEVGQVHETLVLVRDTPSSLARSEFQNTTKHMLPMIERHLEQLQDRLTAQERRWILGHRLTTIGRGGYRYYDPGGGAKLLLRSIACGHTPLETAAFLLHAAPPVRAAKSLLRGVESPPHDAMPVALAAEARPQFCVFVDVDAPLGSRLTALQHLFDRHNIKPVLLLDYPTAGDNQAVAPIKTAFDAGAAEVGSLLRSQLTPPNTEGDEARERFAGNLSFASGYRKISALTELLGTQLGAAPLIYRAEHHGLGAASSKILLSLGYQVDASVLPNSSFAGRGGPDFIGFPDQPYWFGAGFGLLEVPTSCGFTGLFAGAGPALAGLLEIGGSGATGSALLRRVSLSPERYDVAQQIALIKRLRGQGHRVFSLSVRASRLKLESPYIRGEAVGQDLLLRLDAVLSALRDQFDCQPTTPLALRGELLPRRSGGIECLPEAT